MSDSEWKLHLHREGKFMGLKNHSLLYGGEGEQNQGVIFFEDEGFQRGQQWKRSKRLVGQEWQASSKVRAPDCQPIMMVNRGNYSVGKPYCQPYPVGHQGNIK